jgi:hypothetical protein
VGQEGDQRRSGAVQDWQALHDACTKLLETAWTFNGTSASEPILTSGEAVFYRVPGASLIEDRKTQGHYQAARAASRYRLAASAAAPSAAGPTLVTALYAERVRVGRD